MANKQRKSITIDLDTWCTQQDKARLTGQRLNTISQQVKRTKAGQTSKPVEILEIPELNNLVLVKR